MECESTPTILWMSSDKRYIWYFMLRYRNPLSKHGDAQATNRKKFKHLAVEQTALPSNSFLDFRPRGAEAQCPMLVQSCGLV